MSTKGYGIELFVCACAVIIGLCIAGPGLMRVGADSKVDTANLMIRLNNGDIATFTPDNGPTPEVRK